MAVDAEEVEKEIKLNVIKYVVCITWPMESFLPSDELFSVEAATLQRKLDSLEATSSNALSFAAFYGMPWRLVFRWRGMPENVELRLDRTAERMQHLLEAGGKIDSLRTLLVLKKAFPAIPLHAATIGSSQIRIFLTAAWEALCHPEGVNFFFLPSWVSMDG